MKKIIIFLFLCWTVESLGTFLITKPGRYELGGDLNDTGTDVITIAANDVVLDLGGRIVSGGLDGIVVKSDVSGVSIQNGFISEVEGAGISIKERASRISIHNILINKCGGPAIEILGTSTGDIVSNILIENVVSSSCSFSVTSSSVFLATYGNAIVFRNIVIDSTINLVNELSLIKFDHCNVSRGFDILGINNIGASLIGVNLITSASCVFEDCDFSGNAANGADFFGFRLTDSSISNLFIACRVIAGSSFTDDATGFYFGPGSQSNVIRDSLVDVLEGNNNAFGVVFSSSGAPGNNECNIVEDMTVSKCIASTGTAIGFNIDGSDRGKINSSFLGFNSAPSGLAAGIRFVSGTGGNRWTLIENEFVENIGMDDANSFGVLLLTGSRNVFVKNIASENGLTLANQLSGVPAGSISLVAEDMINTVSAPWTNLGVTP